MCETYREFELRLQIISRTGHIIFRKPPWLRDSRGKMWDTYQYVLPILMYSDVGTERLSIEVHAVRNQGNEPLIDN